MELRKLEEREDLTKDVQNIRGFQREIENCFNKHLDEKLNNFITKHNLRIDTDEDVVYWLIKYNQSLKE